MPTEIQSICRLQDPIYTILPRALTPVEIITTPSRDGSTFCAAEFNLDNRRALLTCWYNLETRTVSNFTVIGRNETMGLGDIWFNHKHIVQTPTEAVGVEGIEDEDGRKFLFGFFEDGQGDVPQCFGKIIPTTTHLKTRGDEAA